MAPMRWLRRMYDWVLSFSKSPRSRTALFFLAMAESSFFPIAPDVLLIALCIGSHKRWRSFALICSLGSVIGGALGYYIGYAMFDLIGETILGFVGSISGNDPDQLLTTAKYWFTEKEMYGVKVGGWAVGIAGFTTIPYKVFTIASGFFQMNFVVFIVASAISRSLRFFMVAGIIGLLFEKYGEKINEFIDRYFNLLSILFVLLTLTGIAALRLF